MSSEFVHLFPLSVYRDTLELDEPYRQRLVELTLGMEHRQADSRPAQSAWLGDTQGHEFLFQHPEFTELFRQISKKIRNYAKALGLNTTLISFYYQRAWATVSRQGERINDHSHDQSNISFAYYLEKPNNSGGINFLTENHPNEISRGIFTPSKQELGFIEQPSVLTWNSFTLYPSQGEILIFPSKTLHSTTPNETDSPRISISADVTTMLKDSTRHETLMPHFSYWQSFDEL